MCQRMRQPLSADVRSSFLRIFVMVAMESTSFSHGAAMDGRRRFVCSL